MAAFDFEVIMNIAICDENNSTGEYIKNQAARFMSEKGIEGNCFFFETAVELLTSNELFDVAVINPGFSGTNNAQIINFIKQHNSAVALIFIADDYSYLNDAFDFGARRYLINPDDKTLFPALDSVIDYLNNETAECYLEENGTVKRISKSSIVYLEISGRKTKVVTKNGVYMSKNKMQEFQKNLNLEQFASPHKSFYVNMDQIQELGHLGGQYYIYMSDTKFIPITRTRKTEFEKAYFHFLKNKKSR